MRCRWGNRCGALCSDSECIPGPGPGPGRIRSPGRRFPAVRVAYNQHFTPVYRSRQPSGLPACLPASSSGLPPVPVPWSRGPGVLLLPVVPSASIPAAFPRVDPPVTRRTGGYPLISSDRQRLPSLFLPRVVFLPSFPYCFRSFFPFFPSLSISLIYLYIENS